MIIHRLDLIVKEDQLSIGSNLENGINSDDEKRVKTKDNCLHDFLPVEKKTVKQAKSNERRLMISRN